MVDTGKGLKFKTARKVLSRTIMTVVCALVLIVLALGIYLATPLPARQVSRYLTSYLHQTFTVDRLQTTGATLYLRGVRLANPPGFQKGSLAVADSVALAPQWGDLLLGRQHFRLIALDGIKIHLDRNSKGVWNFAQLQQLFAGKKPSATETRIRELTVKNGALTVGGQGVQGIALQLFNVTTKGSLDSRVDLAFEDAAHDHFALKGKARAGTDPVFDLTLTAPALALKQVAALVNVQRPDLFEGGRGSLEVTTSLHKGELTAAGKFEFSDLRPSVERNAFPLTGKLEFAADYSLPRDAGRLQTCTLTVNNLVKAHARGTAEGFKRDGNFALDLGFEDVDLGGLNAFVPEEVGKNLVFGGRLGSEALHIAGSRSQGVTSASGTLQLHDGALTREGRLLVAGLAGTVGFSRLEAGVLAKGRFSLSGSHEKALLETLDMPFSLTASRQLKPLRAEIPSLSARLMGIPFSGRLEFYASRESPLTASLKVPAAKLATLNPLLKPYDLTATAGTASVELDLAGRSLQELGATAGLQLADVRGSRGKDSFAVKKGSVSARALREVGHLLVQGDAQLKSLAFNGKGGDARFNYRIADKVVYLEGADLSIGGTRVYIAKLRAAIPVKETLAKGTRYPIDLEFDGCAIKQSGLEVNPLTGRLRANLDTDSAGRWLEGAAELSSRCVTWEGKAVADPAVKIAFSRPGAKGEVNGRVLGGTLAGAFSFNPFAPEARATFDLRLKDAGLAAAQFSAKRQGIYPSDGLVEMRINGGYSRRDGLAFRFESKGSRIALAGAGGKTLVSGAGMALAGTLAGERLTISEAVLSPGAGVAVRLKGEFVHALSPQRTGSLTFSLPETAVNNIVDPLINLLPRLIQEATVDGTLAADGKLDLREGKQLLDGSLVLKGGRLEVAAQKLVAAGINGRIPFSLDLAGQAGGRPQGGLNFSRKNYPQLLEKLRKGTGGGQVVTVAKIGFGALELGTLTMHVAAANGITEITSLNSSLYEGALFGTGFATMREGLSYRGDLLVNGLSLKQLCSIFPDIKGYISGRVDGVISLSGGAKGLQGLSGFAELWAREGAGEKMLVSKEFLQRLSKQKLSGFFFRSDRPYDQAEIRTMMEEGDLTFETLKILHANLFGVRDLSVSIAPTQNRIALDHLLDSIKQAAVRGKAAAGDGAPAEEGAPAGTPVTPEFKWGE